jgi:rhamnulokinase
MTDPPGIASAPTDARASIAVDLGAESCRVSLLRWQHGQPFITLVHRFANAPRNIDGTLRWNLAMIESGLDEGLRQCAALATEGVRSIAVDGWAVDYVRLDAHSQPLADPFCYRDERTLHSEQALHQKLSPTRLRDLTGVQQLRINTLYQLHADALAGLPHNPWLNLPEYILFRWGAPPVSEYTNATHTHLIDLSTRQWSAEIFHSAGLDLASAPKLVPPGTLLGKLRGPLATLPALRDTLLVAPACHDTASAIAAIPASGSDWGYISSGTWSLVGTLLDHPQNNAAAAAENFTNLGAAGGQICFHKNVNGMWLLRQCMDAWASEGHPWTIPDLIAAAEKIPPPQALLDVDDPDLLLAGHMPQRINAQLLRSGLAALDTRPEAAPIFASLIFHSLAGQYAKVIAQVEQHTSKKLKRLFVVGGASQNDFLNRLTQQATGLELHRGSPESSTVGNFAVQLAALESFSNPATGPSAHAIAQWARWILAAAE